MSCLRGSMKRVSLSRVLVMEQRSMEWSGDAFKGPWINGRGPGMLLVVHLLAVDGRSRWLAEGIIFGQLSSSVAIRERSSLCLMRRGNLGNHSSIIAQPGRKLS